MIEREKQEIARQIARLVPSLFRSIGSDLRCAGGIIPAHVGLLEMLSVHSFGMTELAERHMVTPATMTNTIAALVERGWVTRAPDEKDRRGVRVEITATGKQALQTIHAHLTQVIVNRMDDLTSSEVEELNSGLIILCRMLSGSNGHNGHGDGFEGIE